MMKTVGIGIGLLLLAGCANTARHNPPAPAPRPAGVIQLLNNDSGGSYADLRNVSTWQGNHTLRRFYMINSYNKPARIRENPPVYILSSRATNVVNCNTNERAIFDRLYLSGYWGEGDVIARRGQIGQWESFPKQSLIGMVAAMVCQIKPERLKPEPAKDIRPAMID